MLTDDEARELLHRAAGTIEVGPGNPLPSTPPRPRWPLLVAAATVLVLAVGGAVLSANEDNQPAPTGPPKGEPVEQPEILDPDQIPSVLGYDLNAPTSLLESKGLVVVEREQPEGCQPSGIVTGTEPSIGARFAPGATVKVFVTSPRVFDCVGEPPWPQIWDLIRFARGLSGPPDVSSDLTLYVDDGDPVTITREQAADPDSWTLCDNDGECHSALAAIEQMATRTWTMNGRHYEARPYVVAGSANACGWTPPPTMGASTREITVWVEVPMDGVFCPEMTVSLHLDPGTGRLNGVGLQLSRRAGDDEVPPAEPTATQREVADAFVAWARGEPTPPPFADEVELRLLDDPWTTLTGEEAEMRELWTLCSGQPGEDCEPNPLRVLEEYDGPVVQSRSLANRCPPTPRDLPDPLTEAVDTELIRLDQPEARNCRDQFAVELWITGEGLIRAVNLLP